MSVMSKMTTSGFRKSNMIETVASGFGVALVTPLVMKGSEMLPYGEFTGPIASIVAGGVVGGLAGGTLGNVIGNSFVMAGAAQLGGRLYGMMFGGQ